MFEGFTPLHKRARIIVVHNLYSYSSSNFFALVRFQTPLLALAHAHTWPQLGLPPALCICNPKLTDPTTQANRRKLWAPFLCSLVCSTRIHKCALQSSNFSLKVTPISSCVTTAVARHLCGTKLLFIILHRQGRWARRIHTDWRRTAHSGCQRTCCAPTRGSDLHVDGTCTQTWNCPHKPLSYDRRLLSHVLELAEPTHHPKQLRKKQW